MGIWSQWWTQKMTLWQTFNVVKNRRTNNIVLLPPLHTTACWHCDQPQHPHHIPLIPSFQWDPLHRSSTGRCQRTAWQYCWLSVMWPGHIILNTQFQAHHYRSCAHHHAVQQSHESEQVNQPRSLREATQVEHNGQIRVMITCDHVFLKLNECFLNRHKPLIFAIFTILHHHPFARAHCPVCPPNPSIATTAGDVVAGIATFMIALSWDSIVLTPQMSLHECLQLAPFASRVGGGY